MIQITREIQDEIVKDNNLTKTAMGVSIQQLLYFHFGKTFTHDIFVTCCNYGLLFANSFLKSGKKFLTYDHAKRVIQPDEFTIYCKSLKIYTNFTLPVFSGWIRNLSDNKDNLSDDEFINLITLIDFNQIIDGNNEQKLAFMCLQGNAESIKNIVEQLYNTSTSIISANNGLSYIIVNYLIKGSLHWDIEMNKIYNTVATVKLAYANSIIRNYDYNSDCKDMFIIPYIISDRQKLNDADICSCLVSVKQLQENNNVRQMSNNDKIKQWIIANPPPRIIKSCYHKNFIESTKYNVPYNEFAEVCDTMFTSFRISGGNAWKINK